MIEIVAERVSQHWPEYAIEGGLLGVFMLIACAGVVFLEHPGSPMPRVLPRAPARRALMGALMGVTAIALIYSPWGRRSGAHMNPATTLTFLALGKVAPIDAAAYVASQFLGGIAGVWAARALLGRLLSHERVGFAATRPGAAGAWVALLAEVLIAFLMMTMVLNVSGDPRFARYTGLCAGVLVFLFITFEAPLSGMSLNPARSLASAVFARRFHGLWVYFVGPTLGMMAAAIVFVGAHGLTSVRCAKLNHGSGAGDGPCIFHCTIGSK